MSLPIEPPRLPEIQEIFRFNKIFHMSNLISKISEMLSFIFLYSKKTTRQNWRMIPLYHSYFQIFSFHLLLLESHCPDLDNQNG